MSPFTEYALPVVAGGASVGAIKYLTVHANPKYAAIFGAFPLGLMSSYFLPSRSDAASYIGVYASFLAILVVVGALYHTLLEHTALHRNACLLLGLVVWAVLVWVRLEV